jgi:hypothetical protein
MHTMADLLTSILNSLSSPPGLVLQSILMLFLMVSAISLINAEKQHIHKTDLRQARTTFVFVLLLNGMAIALQITSIVGLISLSDHIRNAADQLVWSCNLILVGWLWIAPLHRSRFGVFKHILLCTALAFFIIEAFQPIETLFAPLKITIPYLLIWRGFEFVAGIFLFFICLFYSGKMRFVSIAFIVLQILGLGADQVFIVTSQFSQTFAQFLAFLFSVKLYLALRFDLSEPETAMQSPPVIPSDNLSVMPNAVTTKSWLQTALENDAPLLPFTLCKALAYTFHADACLIVQAEKSQTQLKLICGYATENQKQILPRDLLLDDRMVAQKRSVLLHGTETFPTWIKTLAQSIHRSNAQSAWYVPLTGFEKRYLFVMLSHREQWGDDHMAYLKKVMPELVQILHNYFREEHILLPENKPLQTASNPFLELMRTEVNQTKDIQRVEAELQLALEEYNRIRKILEERGIGQ